MGSSSCVLGELVVGVSGQISSRQSTAEQRPGVLGGALLAQKRVWEDRPRGEDPPTRPGQQGYLVQSEEAWERAGEGGEGRPGDNVGGEGRLG